MLLSPSRLDGSPIFFPGKRIFQENFPGRSLMDFPGKRTGKGEIPFSTIGKKE